MAMTRNSLHLALQFHKDLRGWQDGRAVAEALFEEPVLAPERAAAFEDATRRNGVELTGPEDLRAIWAQTGEVRAGGETYHLPLEINWRRWSAPALTGTLQFAGKDVRGRPIPGQLRVTVKAGSGAAAALVRLFDRLFMLLEPEAGTLRPLPAGPGQPVPDDPVAARAASDFAAGIPWTRAVVGPLNTKVEGRSDLGWCGIVATEAIRDADAIRAQADLLERGPLSRIRFGPDPTEALADEAMFEDRRTAVKKALAADAFLVP